MRDPDKGFDPYSDPNPAFVIIPPSTKTLDFYIMMVAHFTMRTYVVNQEFRFVKGIWLHQTSRQIRFYSGKDLFYILRAQHVLSYHLIQVPWSTFSIRYVGS